MCKWIHGSKCISFKSTRYCILCPANQCNFFHCKITHFAEIVQVFLLYAVKVN